MVAVVIMLRMPGQSACAVYVIPYHHDELNEVTEG